MSYSVQPHRWQPTRLPRPWDFPGKNTGVGCYFLLQCMKEKSEREVAQLCPTLCDPMDCGLPGSTVHGFSRQEYWSGVPLPSPLFFLNSNNSTFGHETLTPWGISSSTSASIHLLVKLSLVSSQSTDGLIALESVFNNPL